MQAEFLSAICEEPDEVVHRLVYADWLEEHGTTATDAARAELIRVQIAREAADPDGEEHWDLRARERILVARWGRELAGKDISWFRQARYWGGFLDEGEVGNLVPVPALMRQFPLRMVRFTEGSWWPEVVARLTGVAFPGTWLPHFHSVWMQGKLRQLQRIGLPLREREFGWSRTPTDNLLESLLRTQPGSRLHGLEVGVHHPETWQVLLRSDWLRSLRDLTVRTRMFAISHPLGGLSQTPACAGLRRLSLVTEERDTTEQVGPHLGGLETLHIGSELPGATAHSAMTLQGVPLPGLRSLKVDNSLGELLAQESWPRLHSLILEHAAESDGVAALIRGPYLAQLRRLRVFLEPRELEALVSVLERKPEDQRRLRELSVVVKGPATEAIVRLCGSPVVDRLRTLEVAVRDGDGRSLGKLADRSVAPWLRCLSWHGKPPGAEIEQRLRERFGEGLFLNKSGGLGDEGWV